MSRDAIVIEIAAECVRSAVFAHGSAAPSADASAPIGDTGVARAVSVVLASIAGSGALRPGKGTAAPAGAAGAEDGGEGGTQADFASIAAHADFYISMHPSTLSLRVIDVPFQDRRKINATLPFELSGILPFDADEAVFDALPSGGGKALVVAVEKRVIAELLGMLGTLGIDPAWVGPGFLMVPQLLQDVYKTDAVTTLVTKDFIVTGSASATLFASTFTAPDGLGLSLAYLDSESIPTGAVYAAGITPAELTGVFGAASPAPLALTSGLAPEFAVVAAVGLAISRNSMKTAVNFRRGEFEYTRGRLISRQRLRRTGALALVLITLVCADVYVRYSGLAAELESTRAALRASYTALFPTEKAGAADPVYSLRIKLKELGREASVVRGGVSPLEIMRHLTEAASSEPGLGIYITELQVGEGKLRARGEAASFNAANRFRESLAGRGPFSSVTISDLKSRTPSPARRAQGVTAVERAASFSLLIELGGAA